MDKGRSFHCFVTPSSDHIHAKQGGDDVWGNATFAPDDLHFSDLSHGELIAFRQPIADVDQSVTNMTAAGAGDWILERTPTSFQV